MKNQRAFPWHQRVSLKTAFALIMTGTSLCILLFGILAFVFFDARHMAVQEKHASAFRVISTAEGNRESLIQIEEIPFLDTLLYEHPAMLTAVSVLLFAAALIILSARLLFHWKLKAPLSALNEASDKIANNDLNFIIEVPGNDELGRLCASFEVMRKSLLTTSRALWQATEESHRLNAAFAHDLLTPLTVLQGYGDFTENGLRSGTLKADKQLSTIQFMNRQIKRLKTYTLSMYDIKRLDEQQAERAPVSLQDMAAELNKTADMLSGSLSLRFHMPTVQMTLQADVPLISKVFENLLANALRYAVEQIQVRFTVKENRLAVIVTDDGPGFSGQALKNAQEPYYREGSCDQNLGLGLYSCKLLCEKHGGSLVISNAKHGGGEVYAIFLIN